MADIKEFYRCLSPHVVVLVTCGGKEDSNIITIAWHVPISSEPRLHGVAVHPKRHSHGLLEKCKDWVVNLPTTDILKEAHRCGRVSGRKVKKFEDTGLTPAPSIEVETPSIKECPLKLECRYHSQHSLGDHTLFVGEVVHMECDPGVFEGTVMKKEFSFVGHMGGNTYTDRWGKIFKI